MTSIHSFILIFIAVSLFLGIMSTIVRRGRSTIGFAFILAINLLITVIAFIKDDNGFLFQLSVFLFVLLVAVPAIITAFVRRALLKGKVDRALRLVRLREFLQHGAGHEKERQILIALQMVDQGRLEEAVALGREQLANEQLDETSRILVVDRMTTLFIYDRRWDDAIEVFENEGGNKLASASPRICINMVRAYAEAGKVSQAAQCMSILEASPVVYEPAAIEMINGTRLVFLSHLGCVDVVEKLLSKPSGFVPGLVGYRKQLWLGLAYARAGQIIKARDLWEEVAHQDQDPEAATAAMRRLSELETRNTSDFSVNEDVQALATAVAERALSYLSISEQVKSKWFFGNFPVTTGFLVVIGIVYAAMVVVGTNNDPWLLIKFGANCKAAVLGGEYWRLITSIFLHNGLLHVGLNGYALFLLGRLGERMYGSLRYFSIFILAGFFGSMISAIWGDDFHLSVGASGAIFGLLGAALIGLRQLRGRVPESWRKQLTFNLLMVIALQVVIGLSVKEIDNAAHVGGLIGGTLVGLLLTPSRPIPDRGWGKFVTFALCGILFFVTIGSGILTAINGPQKLLEHIPSKKVGKFGLSAECPLHWVELSDKKGFVFQDPWLLVSPTLGFLSPELITPGDKINEIVKERSSQLLANLTEIQSDINAKEVKPLFQLSGGALQTQFRIVFEGQTFYQINLFKKAENILLMAFVRLPHERIFDYREVVKRIYSTMNLKI